MKPGAVPTIDSSIENEIPTQFEIQNEIVNEIEISNEIANKIEISNEIEIPNKVLNTPKTTDIKEDSREQYINTLKSKMYVCFKKSEEILI